MPKAAAKKTKLAHDNENTHGISSSEIASVLLHQLRNPLSAMRWNLEEVFQSEELKKVSEGVQAKLRQIYDSNLQLISIVHSLSNLNRSTRASAQITTQLIEVDPLKIIAEVAESMRAKAAQRQVSIAVELPEMSQKFHADPELFRQVIQNLVSNAIDYNKIGGKVTLRAAETADKIRIEVADDGIGISPKDQPEMFTKFFRGENAKEARPGGMGLGLFAIKLYVESWGGKIWFESALNRGTTFFIEFSIASSYKTS